MMMTGSTKGLIFKVKEEIKEKNMNGKVDGDGDVVKLEREREKVEVEKKTQVVDKNEVNDTNDSTNEIDDKLSEDHQKILSHKFLDDSSELSELDDSEAETERLDLDLLEEEINIRRREREEEEDEEEEKSSIVPSSPTLREVAEDEVEEMEEVEEVEEEDNKDTPVKSKKRKLSEDLQAIHKRSKLDESNLNEDDNEDDEEENEEQDHNHNHKEEHHRHNQNNYLNHSKRGSKLNGNKNGLRQNNNIIKEKLEINGETKVEVKVKLTTEVNKNVEEDVKEIENDDENENILDANGEHEIDNEEKDADNKIVKPEINITEVDVNDKIGGDGEEGDGGDDGDDAEADGDGDGDGDVDVEVDTYPDADADDDSDQDDLIQKRRQEAVSLLTEIEIDFAKLRDQLHDDKMSRYIAEIEMCADGSHPELEHFYAQLAHIRDEKIRLAQNRRNYQRQCIFRVSTAMRTQAHQQFLKDQADSRVKLLLQTTEEWYKVNRERRAMDALAPEYGYRIASSRGSQIRERMSSNQEITVLEGISKYIGFPAAPEMKPIDEDELQEDLEALGIPR